jgi:hypothetical protein
MNEHPVFQYVQSELAAYKTRSVPLADNWEWNMYEHIKRSFLYKHSKFSEGPNDGSRPFKNIIRPILNVAYRGEGFDVKDVVPYVDDEKDYDKSFFVKKRHDRVAQEKGIDKTIDASCESNVDYGLTIEKKHPTKIVEHVPLERIGFCDQTDFMAGPVCEVHPLSPDELAEQKWDEQKKKEALEYAKAGRMVALNSGDKKADTPGKYVEAYELRGMFPESWLNDSGQAETDGQDSKYIRQLHIIGYYKDKDGKLNGMHFFKGPTQQVYKSYKRTNIFGRACGFGGIEELFDAQQWTNMSEIQQQEMLEKAGIMLLQVVEGKGKTMNVLTELEKGQVLEYEEGHPYTPLSFPVGNINAFKDAVERWNTSAQAIGSASEAVLGQAPTAGTPFKLQALVVQQNFGIHEYRKGQFADYWGEIYREWVRPFLVRDLKKGGKWLSELSLEEMQALADNVVNLQTRQMVNQLLMKGQYPLPEQVETYKQQVRESFMKGGGKKFIKLVEGEIEDIPVNVMFDIAGKQFDLQDKADKLTNIFRQIIAAPQVLQMPGMGKLFNEILEYAGLSPIDFTAIGQLPPQAPQLPQQEPVPANQ